MNQNRKALAEAVRARRDFLGLRQVDMAERGGPSYETMRLVEKGEPGAPYQSRTMAGLERALKWKPGTVADLLNGTANPDPETWVDRTQYRHAEDTAHASDHATAHVTPRSVTGIGTLGAVTTSTTRVEAPAEPTPSDPVALVVDAGWAFLALVREHDGAAPAGKIIQQHVIDYLHDLLVRDLSSENG